MLITPPAPIARHSPWINRLFAPISASLHQSPASLIEKTLDGPWSDLFGSTKIIAKIEKSQILF
jgi:hypothetical protein